MIPLISTLRRSNAVSRALSICLGLLVASAPIATCNADPIPAPAATTSVPGITTIAIFPSANDAGADGAVAASAVDSAVKWRLNASGTYEVTSFSMFLPSIQRALTVDSSDSALTSSDVQEPITSAVSAQKIARAMNTDGYLLEEIDAYREDPITHDISITASGSLFATSTGAAARTFAVTGTASPQSSDEGAEAVMLRAADVTAAEIATTLGAGAAPGKSAVPNSRVGSSSAIGSGLLILLAAALIGVIAHNVSAHGSSGNSTTPASGTGGTGGSGGSGGSGSGSSGNSGPPGPPLL